MEIYSIALKNNLLLFQDLTDEIIENYIQYETNKGKVRKYIFSILYSISSYDNYPNKTLNEIYDYAVRNFKKFFEHFVHSYTEKDIENFALSFALDNYHFTISDKEEIINFISTHFVEYETNNEIIKWCQDKIKLFKVQVYANDVENYRNGTITNLLRDLEETVKNHNESLIYEIEVNPINE